MKQNPYEADIPSASQVIIEPTASSLFLQEHTTYFYPDPDESSPRPPILFS